LVTCIHQQNYKTLFAFLGLLGTFLLANKFKQVENFWFDTQQCWMVSSAHLLVTVHYMGSNLVRIHQDTIFRAQKLTQKWSFISEWVFVPLWMSLSLSTVTISNTSKQCPNGGTGNHASWMVTFMPCWDLHPWQGFIQVEIWLKYIFRNHLSEFVPGFLCLQLSNFWVLHKLVQVPKR
jgi:hypothetical protein